MITLFKSRTGKVWHILNDKHGDYMPSFCHNASLYNLNSPERGHASSVTYEEVNSVDPERHDKICKACVMHAYDTGLVKITLRGADSE